MSDPTPQTINPALVPLDWSFYTTDSSVIFKLEPSPLQPYWVEAHAHFGRFNSLPLSITLTSHKQGLEDGTALLERILKELLQRRLPAFFSRSGPPAGLELQPSIYYFGIHVQMDAIAFDDPLIKHIPRRARAQIEKVLSVIPSEGLNKVMPEIGMSATTPPNNAPEPTPPSDPSLQQPIIRTEQPLVTAASPAPTAPPQTAVAPTQPASKTTKPARKTTKAKTKRSAPSPGFTAPPAPSSQPPAQIFQPDLVSIAAPAQPQPPAAQASATAVMTAPAPAVEGDVWDWDEDDDDIVF